ncbi:MAG TPA: hypothetical protein VN316_01155 [candidate division Zixibacteria bacterium]|nr:hypothetical protein [candidate division Zixibacteria bacterium]
MDIQAVEFEKEMKKLESPRCPLDIVNFLYYKGDVVVESDNSFCKLKPGTGVLVPAGARHRTTQRKLQYSWFSDISRLTIFWREH